MTVVCSDADLSSLEGIATAEEYIIPCLLYFQLYTL
jgi:hypothetical protein